MNNSETLPILYSLRNCPFAMRARIAIFKAQQQVILRDVVLSNKPAEMIAASPKGTVPIIVLEQLLLEQKSPASQSMVIDESLDIMLWVLKQSDPDDLLHQQDDNALANMLTIITKYDTEFKTCLEQYKCAKRYRETNITACRQACEHYISDLEHSLNQQPFLLSEKESLVDIALLPFIRQFARVERQWYLQSPYPKVRQWLNNYLQSPMFTKVMTKYPLWQESHETILFGKN